MILVALKNDRFEPETMFPKCTSKPVLAVACSSACAYAPCDHLHHSQNSLFSSPWFEVCCASRMLGPWC